MLGLVEILQQLQNATSGPDTHLRPNMASRARRQCPGAHDPTGTLKNSGLSNQKQVTGAVNGRAVTQCQPYIPPSFTWQVGDRP